MLGTVLSSLNIFNYSFFKIKQIFVLFMYFGYTGRVFTSVHGLSPAAASGGCSPVAVFGLLTVVASC